MSQPPCPNAAGALASSCPACPRVLFPKQSRMTVENGVARAVALIWTRSAAVGRAFLARKGVHQDSTCRQPGHQYANLELTVAFRHRSLLLLICTTRKFGSEHPRCSSTTRCHSMEQRLCPHAHRGTIVLSLIWGCVTSRSLPLKNPIRHGLPFDCLLFAH